jgi:serine-type D-Ala-D-Ala carboxypeptidase
VKIMSLRTAAAGLLLATIASVAAAPTAPAAAVAVHATLSEIRDPSVVGMDAAALRRIDALIEAAIAAKVTPGAALAIGRHGQLVRLRGYGRVDWKASSARVTERTIYDLASLTKPVATTTAVMLLVQEGRLELDRPLALYLSEWRGIPDRAAMTPRHLLNHTSGLPAGGPLTGVGTDRSRIAGHLAGLPLHTPPGRRHEYSDYGMILLGALVERVAGERLDAFLEKRMFEPLGLQDTGFNPLRWSSASPLRQAAFSGAPLLSRIAPTEHTARRGHIQGVVHDPLAFRLGGVAGHAGLFGSAHDLAVYAELLLGGGRSGETQFIDGELLASFTTRPGPAARFALGWELARDANSSGGFFPPTAFGHAGFTGTSMWLDRDRGLYVVLLTNRLNPNSRERRHIRLRHDLHEAVGRAIMR